MVTVRGMGEADVDAVSAIRVRGWQAAYAGLLPARWLDAMSVEEDAAARRDRLRAASGRVENLVAVADTGGEVMGWACHGPYRGEPDGSADRELYALYVRPDAVGTGVGRALMDAVLARAAGPGAARMLLWVLADNTRARRFYERAGFLPDGEEQTDTYDGVPAREVRYARPLR
jgi:GNAT superfamily N-acetyltransferase